MRRKSNVLEPEPWQKAQIELKLPVFGPRGKLILYPLSLLQPAAGLILAALYLPQAQTGAKRFGRLCLILALLSFILRGLQQLDLSGWRDGESLLQRFY